MQDSLSGSCPSSSAAPERDPKYNAIRTIKGFADIVLLWFWRSYSIRPIHPLGGIRVLFFVAAAIFGCRTVWLFITDWKLSSTLEPLLTVFSFIAGLVTGLEAVGKPSVFHDRGMLLTEAVVLRQAPNFLWDLRGVHHDVWFSVYSVSAIFTILAGKRPVVTGVYHLIPFLARLRQLSEIFH
ncbi:hypothetical protein [Bradyrhizobium manausense]|uniref:Uncharacterized protein n=1 Tax=Bradyrhizobium manausense TaxID=989370 RepID=A0A0R3DQQ6_9BRAD|nr:hypothetical protein [Bradyrhizobium manausense]KRQ10132.1 hypothetical protein AOQ71_19355 [Bradyrhizobium manausense]